MATKTQPARGMRDFLPADVRRREYVIGVIKEVYERYGFEPLETPAVENIETLLGKYGEEGNQLIYKILKRGVHESSGEADLALRYDLTVPLARVVAEYRDKLPKFFKRYQIQPVWRADRPARGRFREFYQCDVDVLGSRSMLVEAELIAAASDVLTRLRFADFTIRLNHRQILTGLLNSAGVPSDKHDSALIALDKLGKIGLEGVKQELTKRGIGLTKLKAGTELSTETSLLAFLLEISSLGRAAHTSANSKIGKQSEVNASVLTLLAQFLGNDHIGVKELRSILTFVELTGSADRIRIDPSLARGLSYYTGAIMEIGVEGLAGSVAGGGRYDNLVGMFLGQDVPACGFSLGLERIIVVMTERNLFPPELIASPAELIVIPWDEDSVSDAFKLADEARRSNLRVLFQPETRKPTKQLFMATNRKIRFAVIVGPDERRSARFEIRDLAHHTKFVLERGEIGPHLVAQLASEKQAGRKGRSIRECLEEE